MILQISSRQNDNIYSDLVLGLLNMKIMSDGDEDEDDSNNYNSNLI